MQTHPHQFSKGTAFRIKNRKTQRFLSANLREVDTHGSNDSQQCWIVHEVRDNQFEIVQMRSGQLLSWPTGRTSLRLQRNRGSFNSLWTINHAESTKDVDYFWIRPIRDKSKAVCASALSSKVKVSGIDPILSICLWEFSRCDLEGRLFTGLSIIRSESSKLVLEVSGCSTKQGAPVTQAQYSGCGNQRWIIETYRDQKSIRRNQFILRNFCSGLIVTAQFTRGSGRVAQECFRCDQNQSWRLLSVGDNTFLLQSVGNQLFYLSSPGDKDVNVALTQQRGNIYWIIQGEYSQDNQ